MVFEAKSVSEELVSVEISVSGSDIPLSVAVSVWHEIIATETISTNKNFIFMFFSKIIL